MKRIRVGQVWKKNDSGDAYLVTKLYNEALSTIAVLRKTGAEMEALLRVKVEHGSDGQTLPGFTPTQDAREF